MGIISNYFNKPGPGVPKGEARKKGFARFGELFIRDNSNLLKTSILMFVVYAVAWALYVGGNVLAAGGSAAGFIACFAGIFAYGLLLGPAYTASFNAVSKSLRDAPEFFWDDWKKVFRSSFRQTAVPGMIYTGVTAFQMLAVDTMLASPGDAGILMPVLMVVSAMLFHMIAPYYFLQASYLELGVLDLLKNSVFLTFAKLPRTLVGALISGVYWIAFYFLQPFSWIVGLVIGTSVSYLVQLMWIWPGVDETFEIEKTFQARNESMIEDVESLDFRDPVVNQHKE